MASYTTSDLLDQIKRKAFIPESQSTFTDAELLSVATDEIHNTILPAVLNTREEFYVYSQDLLISAGISQFDIPYRAVGMGLREVSMVTGGTERSLPRYDLEDQAYDDGSGALYGFYIQNNTVNIFGNEAGNLRLYYYLRPGKLVTTLEAAQVTAVDLVLNTITVNAIPSGWAVGSVVDIIGHKSGFDVKDVSNTITNITGLVITLSNALPLKQDLTSSVVVNNWITLEDTSPIPQMPVEFFQYLAEAATAYIMESLGDSEGYTRSQQRMQQMLHNAQKIISPRVDGQSKKLVPRRNRGSNTFANWRRY